MILQKIRMGVVASILINIPSPNIFQVLHFSARFHENCQATFGRREH